MIKKIVHIKYLDNYFVNKIVTINNLTNKLLIKKNKLSPRFYNNTEK